MSATAPALILSHTFALSHREHLSRGAFENQCFSAEASPRKMQETIEFERDYEGMLNQLKVFSDAKQELAITIGIIFLCYCI